MTLQLFHGFWCTKVLTQQIQRSFCLPSLHWNLGKMGILFGNFQGAGRGRGHLCPFYQWFLQSKNGETWRNMRDRQVQIYMDSVISMSSSALLQMDTPARSFLNLWCYTEIDLPMHITKLPVTANSNLRRSFSGSTATRMGLAWTCLCLDALQCVWWMCQHPQHPCLMVHVVHGSAMRAMGSLVAGDFQLPYHLHLDRRA